MKNVTVEVSNPGGLTTDTAASVKVDGFVCSAEEHSAAKTETTLSVEISGNKSLEIENLLIHEGSYVEKKLRAVPGDHKDGGRVFKGIQGMQWRAQMTTWKTRRTS